MARILDYPEKGVPFQQGETGAGPILLIKGWVKLERMEEDGAVMLDLRINETPETRKSPSSVAAPNDTSGSIEEVFRNLDLTRIYGGCLLGYYESRFGSRHFVRAETVTPCKLCFLETDEIVRAECESEIVAQVLKELDYLESRHKTRLLTRAPLRAKKKLPEFLWDLTSVIKPPIRDGATKLYLPLTTREQSRAIGVTRQCLYRTFRRLDKRGVASKTNGRIDILKLDELWHRED